MQLHASLRYALAIYAVALFAMFPAGAQVHAQTPERPRIAEDAPAEIVAKGGAAFEVTLPSQPSTGYGWGMAFARSSGLEHLVFLGQRYAGIQAIPGGTGSVIFQFLATGLGEAQLTFDYLRPWEKAVPAKSVTYRIRIAP